MDSDIQIGAFDIRRVCEKDGAAIVIAGGRKCGKSTLIQDILFNLHRHANVPRAIVFSDTEKSHRTYTNFGIPARFVMYSFDANIVQRIYSQQEELTEMKNKGMYKGDHRIAIVMDGCGLDEKIFKTALMRNLFTTGPDYGIFLIISLPYVIDIPATIRNQIDFFFALRLSEVQDRTKVYKKYAGVYERFDEFSDVLQSITIDFRCMVVDLVEGSTDPNEKVFAYRARLGCRCRFGSPEYRDYARQGSGEIKAIGKTAQKASVANRRKIKVKTA